MRMRYFKFHGKIVYKAWWNFFAVVCDVFGRTELFGYENIPTGACIVAGNHVSFLDATAMAFFHESELCAVARDTLMNGRVTGPLFCALNAVAVRRGESGNLRTFREVIARARAGISVIIFPEGTRSPDGTLQKGKPGLGLIAIKSGVPILPVRSFGFEEILPKSGILQGGSRVFLCAGRPITADEIDSDKTDTDRSQKIVDSIMARIASIQKPRVFEV